MSLSNVQAQLGNILAAMPLKLQKVDAAFLDDSTPPFEGAVVSDEQGQFYIGDFNSNGDLFWKPVRDTISMSESSTSEAFVTYNLPVGFESSTISFGKTLTGDLVSVFVQIETPVAADILFYATTIANIQKDKFDLFISDAIRTTGFKLHVFARAYANPDSDGDGVLDNEDAFPYDASETTDTDSDGVGDNADAFPDDPTESLDTDGDGVGDNTDPDIDGDGIPNESDADYSATLSSTFSGVSFVTQAVGSGTNLLQVDDVSGLSLGDTVIIDEGTAQEEEAVIAGFGSLILSSPLSQPHNIGATVRKKDTLSLISLPSGVVYNSDGSNITSISVDGIIFNAADGVYSNSTYAPHDFNGNSVPSSSLVQGFDTSYRTTGGSVLNLTFTRINGYLEVQSMSVGWSDVDGDGYGEHADDFPDDATENVDTDADGVGDNSDAFPNDSSESSDSDGDGVGDNADFFPNDPGRNVEGIDVVIDYSYINGGAAIPHQHTINLDKTSEIKNRTHKFISGAIASATVINARITSPAWVRVGYSGTDLPLTLTNRKSEYAVYSWGQGYNIFYDITIPGVDADGNWINPEQVIDTDRDGTVDSNDAFPSDPTESLDSDEDGVGDNADAFPDDATETLDTDGDGVGDNADAFPNDPDEDTDTDLDGVGDNADAFPNDPDEDTDTDLDGVGDNADAFPNDPDEDTDTDLDGVGDNADAFPNDPDEDTDTDLDGVGDNADAFPNDPDEDTDTDSDDVGDNADDFPEDSSRSWSEVEFSSLGGEILLSANDLSASLSSVGAEILLSSSVDELIFFGLDTQVGLENVGNDPDEFNISSIISQIDIGDISAASSDSTTISNLSIQIVLEEV